MIKVLCCLHNIIRIVGGDDLFDEHWVKENRRPPQSGTSSEIVNSKAISPAEARLANAMRDEIANKM